MANETSTITPTGAFEGTPSNINYLNYLDSLHSQTAKITEMYFPNNGNGPVMLNHKGLDTPKLFIEARTFLQKNAGISDQELDAVFTPDGRFKQAEEDGIEDPYQLSPFEFAAYLREKVLPVYNLINRSLDTSTPNGFNRHGIEHIDKVLERGIAFLQDIPAGNDPDTVKMFIAAAIGHDLGNLLSRTHHPELSLQIFQHLVPGLAKDERKWQRIKEAILLHDEPKLKQLILRVWNTGEEIIDAEGKHLSTDIVATSEAMRESIRPETLVLIAADKVDFGRERVSEQKHDPVHLEQDRHTRVNMLVETTDARRYGNTFVLELTYDERLSPDEEKRFMSLVHPGRRGNRVLLPEAIHNGHKYDGIPHSKFIEDDFWEIYSDRLPIATAAITAMYPKGWILAVVARLRDPQFPSHKYPDVAQQYVERERVFSVEENTYLNPAA